jgi:flagellar hook-basal body complex protein FliE
MAINPASAANAYANASRMAQTATPGGGEDFGKLLQNAAANFVGTLDKSEQASLQAVTGKADLTAVTEAVSNAEMALQTVVAVRDRVISAYQDIIKMTI